MKRYLLDANVLGAYLQGRSVRFLLPKLGYTMMRQLLVLSFMENSRNISKAFLILPDIRLHFVYF